MKCQVACAKCQVRTGGRRAFCVLRPAADGAARSRDATRKTQHGFTLIELMVVLGIMAIILAIGVPSILRIWKKEGIRKAVADVVEVCSKARAQAILSGAPASVVFRSEDSSFSVQGSGGGGGGNAEATESEASGTGTSGQLPDGVGFLKLILNGCDYVEYKDTTRFSFNFYPNGTCDDALIELLSEKGDLRRITFELTTGLADVEVVR